MRTKSQIRNFILDVMTQKNVTKKDMGEQLGVTGSTQVKVQKVNQFLNPKSDKIHLENLTIAASVLGLTPEQILFEDENLDEKLSCMKEPLLSRDVLVPVLTGPLIIKNSYTFGDNVQWMVAPDNTSVKKTVAYHVTKSEESALFHGSDTIFIDRRVAHYTLQDSIVLAHDKENVYICSFRRHKDGSFELRDGNLKGKTLSSLQNKDLEIYGVVTHVISRVHGRKQFRRDGVLKVP